MKTAKSERTGIVLAMAAIVGMVFSTTAFAQDPKPLKIEMESGDQVVQEVSSLEDEMIGYIDWENNVVYAVGDGVPPQNAVSPAQARVRAKRAAIDTAMARLLETIKEVRVDSQSTTRNFINENHVVNTRVSGLVKNAVVEELRQAADGSYQIKMSMPIHGENGISAALLPFEMSKVNKIGIVTRVTRPQAGQKMKQRAEGRDADRSLTTEDSGEEKPAGASEAAPETEILFTGLVIDAKGLKVSAAIYPTIKTAGGKIIYSLGVADPNAAVSDGLCAYRKDVGQARKLSRIGENPLLIKAADVDGENRVDLVLKEEDGEDILQADHQTGFLKETRVVIVID